MEPGAPAHEVGAEQGRLVAVWGPTGAPGRTTVAVTLADELAAAGVPTLLADADTYGGAVAQVLGLLDEAPGLAAAAAAADAGALDAAGLAALAQALPDVPLLRVLTGIARPQRWPELRPAALTVVWNVARGLVARTVVDCGFGLEQETAPGPSGAQRNGATLATLEDADEIVVVGAADPVGLSRLVRGLTDLQEVAPPGVPVRVLLTRVRRGPMGPEPERRLTDALTRFRVSPALLVPADPDGCDRALLARRTLREVAPASGARLALAGLAAELAQGLTRPGDTPTGHGPGRRRRLLGRRR